MEGADAVVHLAARASVPRSLEDPIATHEVNATGHAAGARGGPPGRRGPGGRGVLVLGLRGQPDRFRPARTWLPLPLSPYAASKLAAEAYALAYAPSFGLPVLVFRFFNVFGPLQRAGHAYAAVVPAFVAAALAGEASPVHGDGGQTRDFTFVGSVVRVLGRGARPLGDRTRPREPRLRRTGARSSSSPRTLGEVLGRPLALGPRPGPGRRRPRLPGRPAPPAGVVPRRRARGAGRGLRATVDWFRAGPAASPPDGDRSDRSPGPVQRQPSAGGVRICHAAAPGRDA